MKTITFCSKPILSLMVAVALSAAADGKGNNFMFPPEPVAKNTIDLDGRGFIVNGNRTFLSAGSMHYPRVPRQLWEDRLLRMKQGSFNTLETYAFWSLHEPTEGHFDFSGEKDIAEFYKTAQKLGLYAIARVGPYVCAEWDAGGYPIWLRSKPEAKMRTDNAEFLKYSDRWYGEILKVLAPLQIHRGGNIILMQLENEHPEGSGTAETPYLKHLRDTALRGGMEVPNFFSGMAHGHAPVPKEDNDARPTPWFSTEFWAGWFDRYGPVETRKLRLIEDAQWKIMALGGAGQNFYMLHGGTNFDNCNDTTCAASYDYGAAIGQAGDLRPHYYRMKRANQLAQSFPGIVANGANAAREYKDFCKGSQILGARRSAAGTIVFLQNDSFEEVLVEFRDGTKLHAAPKEILPVVIGAKLTDDVKIADSTVRVLGVAHNGKTATVVVHGKPGDSGNLVLESMGPLKASKTDDAFAVGNAEGGRLPIRITIPADIAGELYLEGGKTNVRVVAINRDLGLHTWIVGEPDRQFVVCGSAFVRSVEEKNGQATAVIERPYGQPAPGHVAIFGGKSHHLAAPGDKSLESAPAPTLSGWKHSMPLEAAPGFNDSSWLASADPQQMGADKSPSVFAWYRTAFEAPESGKGALIFKSAPKLNIFVNGKLFTDGRKTPSGGASYAIEYDKGANTVAILVSHRGRAHKVYDTLESYDRKGIYDPVTVRTLSGERPLINWKMRGGVFPEDPRLVWTAGRPDEKKTSGPVFIKATFTAKPPAETGAYPIYRADYQGLRAGTMWLNGKNLGRYPDKLLVKSLYLPETWIKNGENELVVFDEQGAGDVKIVVEQPASREIIALSRPTAPSTPIVVPPENEKKNLAALNEGNFAFRAPASASTSKPGESPSAATDGDMDSSWCADKERPDAWFAVDLGEPRSFSKCEILWVNKADSYKFILEGSADGQTWSKICDQTSAEKLTDDSPALADSPARLSRLTFPTTSARHVRVSIPWEDTGKRLSPRSIAEFRLFAK